MEPSGNSAPGKVFHVRPARTSVTVNVRAAGSYAAHKHSFVADCGSAAQVAAARMKSGKARISAPR